MHHPGLTPRCTKPTDTGPRHSSPSNPGVSRRSDCGAPGIPQEPNILSRSVAFWGCTASLGAGTAGPWTFVWCLPGAAQNSRSIKFISVSALNEGLGLRASGWSSFGYPPGPAPRPRAPTPQDCANGQVDFNNVDSKTKITFSQLPPPGNDSGCCCGWARGQLCSPCVPKSPKPHPEPPKTRLFHQSPTQTPALTLPLQPCLLSLLIFSKINQITSSCSLPGFHRLKIPLQCHFLQLCLEMGKTQRNISFSTTASQCSSQVPFPKQNSP